MAFFPDDLPYRTNALFLGKKTLVQFGCLLSILESIASYSGCHRTTVLKALQELVDYGWLEVTRREPGKPVVYRVIDHEEWAKKNSGLCAVKDVMPWEGEGDPLGKELYSVSGGQARFLPRQMNGLRKCGLTDEKIVAEFRVFLERNPHSGAQWKRIYYDFRTSLFHAAKALSKIANEPNSSSEGSLLRYPHPSRGSDTPRSVEATGTRSVHATQVFELNSKRESGVGVKQLFPLPLRRSGRLTRLLL